MEITMGGQPQSLQGMAAPNQTYDMSIPMQAPATPGTYAGWWQMVKPQNVAFGTRVWVQIVVPAPQPTPVAPSIEYFAGPQSAVQVGEVIPLSWVFSTAGMVSAKLTRTNPDVSTPGAYEDLALWDFP